MGIAAAAGGAAKSLREILQERALQAQVQIENQRAQEQMQLQRQRMVQEGTQFDAQMGATNRRIGLDEQQFAAEEDERGYQRRQATNKAGVRQLAIEGLRANTAKPRDAQLMAASEGVDLPTDLVNPNADIEDYEAKRKIDLKYRPPSQAEPDYEWVTRNGQPVQIRKGTAQLGDRPYEKGAQPTGPSAYSQERNLRTLQNVSDLKGKVSRWTTGAGSLLAGIPETDARNFKAELDTLKANIAFNELTEMREASKTGGALGSVAVRELALLESTLGALDQGQSPDNLAAQLQKIEDHIKRWNAAKAGQNINLSPQANTGGGGRRFTILGSQ